MIAPSEIESRLERILLRVQKPGRYVGGELNQVVKDWESVLTRAALIFPDAYEIGLPNLALAILYHQINDRPDALVQDVQATTARTRAEFERIFNETEARLAR